MNIAEIVGNQYVKNPHIPLQWRDLSGGHSEAVRRKRGLENWLRLLQQQIITFYLERNDRELQPDELEIVLDLKLKLTNTYVALQNSASFPRIGVQSEPIVYRRESGLQKPLLLILVILMFLQFMLAGCAPSQTTGVTPEGPRIGLVEGEDPETTTTSSSPTQETYVFGSKTFVRVPQDGISVPPTRDSSTGDQTSCTVYVPEQNQDSPEYVNGLLSKQVVLIAAVAGTEPTPFGEVALAIVMVGGVAYYVLDMINDLTTRMLPSPDYVGTFQEILNNPAQFRVSPPDPDNRIGVDLPPSDPNQYLLYQAGVQLEGVVARILQDSIQGLTPLDVEIWVPPTIDNDTPPIQLRIANLPPDITADAILERLRQQSLTPEIQNLIEQRGIVISGPGVDFGNITSMIERNGYYQDQNGLLVNKGSQEFVGPSNRSLVASWDIVKKQDGEVSTASLRIIDKLVPSMEMSVNLKEGILYPSLFTTVTPYSKGDVTSAFGSVGAQHPDLYASRFLDYFIQLVGGSEIINGVSSNWYPLSSTIYGTFEQAKADLWRSLAESGETGNLEQRAMKLAARQTWTGRYAQTVLGDDMIVLVQYVYEHNRRISIKADFLRNAWDK
ncbi:MAG: hypothetical protein H6772_01335 [Pseudomonadales bacterium]|nr:hypothetical protein [Pseudomonadales bacterium]